MSTAFLSTSIIQDFQDSPDDEDDIRSSQEYLNDLEEEYQARALLAKSKRFFKKGTQRFSSAKATDQSECYKFGKKELRPTKDFEAKYNKVKVKLALPSLSALASKAATIKNKVLMALAEDNDVASKEGARNGEWVKISMRKIPLVSMQKDLVFVKFTTGWIFLAESQRNKNDPSVVVTDSSVTNYDSADESSVCSTHLPSLKKLDGVEPVS
ncbi:hypothetical protein Tco_1230334 [Tanacetum coccineum]